MADPPSDPKPCAFGPFVFDPANRRLLRAGVPVPITARVFDILSALIQHAGEPLDKERLVQLVWGDAAVEEGNLARNVSTLRRVLGEQPDDHRYIVTLPGRGYQFVAAIRPLPAEADGGSPATPAPPMTVSVRPRKARQGLWLGVAAAVVLSIAGAGWRAYQARAGAARGGPSRVAVLPFKNIGPSDDLFFALGMTEEVTARLSAVRDLRVISRTSTDRYTAGNQTAAQIGADLGVDYLLEGSVRVDRSQDSNGRLRVTAQLIRTSDDIHLWSETYDRTLDDVFDLQSEIARQVVVELRGALAPEDTADLERAPTTSLEAYRAYVRGTFFAGLPNLSEAHLTRVVAEFQRAVDLDSQFALAYAGLSRAHEAVYRFAYDVSEERKAMAARALERAEALAPESPAVLIARSRYAAYLDGDEDRAILAADAAERLRPHSASVIAAAANSRLVAGRWEDAAAGYERAAQLDPRDASLTAVLGLLHTAMKRHAEADLALDRSLAIEPEQVLANVVRVWNIWLRRGDVATARAQLERLKRHDDWRFAELRFLQALYEQQYGRAREALAPFAGGWMRDWVLTRPVVLLEAQAWRLAGESARARTAFEDARALLEAEARRIPSDARIRSSLAIAHAGLGRVDDARRHVSLALASLRYPQALDATTVREDVALALTMIGDVDEALTHLDALLRHPGFFSVHLLRLDPRWDRLRSVPRYRELVGLSDPDS